MSYNLPDNVTNRDIEEAAPHDDTPPWEEPGEILLREGDQVWLREGDSKPVLVQIRGMFGDALGNFKIWAREVER